MKCEKEQIRKEIEALRKQQSELRNKIREIERDEQKEEKRRVDIASKINNICLLDYIFPYYDNLYDSLCTRKCSGKVVLRSWKSMPHRFEDIRKIAHSVTDYVILSKRSDNYIEQKTIHRKLNQLSDEELDIVARCTDEIIEVLYKYKMLCSKNQKTYIEDFLVERNANAES